MKAYYVSTKLQGEDGIITPFSQICTSTHTRGMMKHLIEDACRSLHLKVVAEIEITEITKEVIGQLYNTVVIGDYIEEFIRQKNAPDNVVYVNFRGRNED